jgi:hypothetical protein
VIHIIDNFYEESFFKKVITATEQLPFTASFQPPNSNTDDRLQAYPTWETKQLEKKDPIHIYVENTLKKLVHEPFTMYTFFRKTLLSELKKSNSWEGLQRHKDEDYGFLAGVIYLNSNSIHDGTSLYNNFTDIEPTLIVGSKTNRLILYNAQQPHSPGVKQWKEERLVQLFFLQRA